MNNTIYAWSPKTGKEIFSIFGNSWNPHVYAFSDCERMIAVCGSQRNVVNVYSLESGRKLYSIQSPNEFVTCLSIVRKDPKVIIGHNNGTILFWDILNSNKSFTKKIHENEIRFIKISPDGKRIVTNGLDNNSWILDAVTGEKLFKLDGSTATDNELGPKPPGRKKEFQFIEDGRKILGIQEGCKIRLWDARNGNEFLTFTGHGHLVRDFCISPNGKFLASASSDYSVRIWDLKYKDWGLKHKKKLLMIKKHGREATSVSYFSNGKRVLSASADSTMQIWEPESEKVIYQFKLDGPNYFAELSPDEKMIFATNFGYGHLYIKNRPEEWFGILYLMEFWFAFLFTSLFIVNVLHNKFNLVKVIKDVFYY